MKRTAIKRRTPLRRKAWMRQRSEKRIREGASPPKRSRYRARPRETERMLWIKTLPCCAPGPHRCHRDVQAHHAGKKPGLRLKAPDDTCIPLCRQAHVDLDAMSGAFRAFNGESLRAWQDEQIAHYRALWEQRQAALAVVQVEHAPGPGGVVAPTDGKGLPPPPASTTPHFPPSHCQHLSGGGTAQETTKDLAVHGFTPKNHHGKRLVTRVTIKDAVPCTGVL